MAEAKAFLGAGDLYIRRYNANTGALEEKAGPFECTQFEIQPQVEQKNKISKSRDRYGQVIASVAVPQPATFSVTLGEVNREALALALMGTVKQINTQAGTVTDADPEVITAKIGSWVELANQNWKTVTVKDDTGTTTFELDKDYQVNYRLGMIRVLEGGAISAGDSLHVTGEYNAVSGTLISGATQPDMKAQFQLYGKNFVDNMPCIVDVWKAVVASSTAFNFLADDFGEVPLTGNMETPPGKDEPYTVKLLDTVD